MPEDLVTGLPPAVPAHDAMALMRVHGASWPDIHRDIEGGRQAALQAGYSSQEINEQQGWPDPQPSLERIRAHWAGADPATAAGLLDRPQAAGDLMTGLRGDYATAIMDGHARGPHDYATNLVNGYLQEWHADENGVVSAEARGKAPALTDEIVKQLPSHDDASDFATALAAQGGMPLEPASIAQAKDALMRGWAETGRALKDIYVDLQGNAWFQAARRTVDDVEGIVKDALGGLTVENSADEAKGVLRWAGEGAAIAADRLGTIARGLGTAINPVASMERQNAGAREALGAFGDVATFLTGGLMSPLAVELRAPAVAETLADVKVPVFDPLKPPGGAADLSTVGEVQRGAFPKPEPGEPPADLTPAQQTGAALWQSFKDIITDTGAAIRPPNPTYAGDREAAQEVIRKYRGLTDQEVAAHFQTVEQYRDDVRAHMPEFVRWLKQGAPPTAPKPIIMNLIDYMEGRSSGVALDPRSNLGPLADALRDINEAMRLRIEQHFPNFTSFYDDYYRHLWQNPQVADQIFGVNRQGSGSSLRARSIPTISDGIANGLVPKILDPIDNVMHYTLGMSRFLAAKDILAESLANGYVTYRPGFGEPGETALTGRAAVIASPNQPGVMLRAFAPDGFARPYNNWIARGFYDNPITRFDGSIYNGLQYANNATVAMKLALSGYHWVNMGIQAAVSSLANGLGEVAGGEIAQGLRDIGMGVTVVPAFVRAMREGGVVRQNYLQRAGDPISRLLAEAGGRGVGRGDTWSGVASTDVSTFRGRPEIWQALAQGAWKQAGSATGRALIGSPNPMESWGSYVSHAPFRILGSVLDNLNAPLFDAVIPRLKNAAFADEMQAWIRRNPTATWDEKVAWGRRVVDHMDDRFGELNQDNLFWNRYVKQALNLATISVGWEFGTLRAFGVPGLAKAGLRTAMGDIPGGIEEIAKTFGDPVRARWLMAMPIVTGLMGAVYQYLHTGLLPTSTQDLFQPRTGGTVPDKQGSPLHENSQPVPERAILPGYTPTAMQWYKMIASAPDTMSIVGQTADTMALNKLSPMWQFLNQMRTGEDAIGHHIFSQPEPPLQQWGLPGDLGNALRQFGRMVEPIVGEQQVFKGTGITPFERLMGLRPPALFFEDRPEFDRRQQRWETKKARTELLRARSEANQQEQ